VADAGSQQDRQAVLRNKPNGPDAIQR